MSQTVQKRKKNHNTPKPNIPKHTTPKPNIPKQDTSKPKDDIYTVFEQSVDMYYKEVKANTATYLQAVTDLQEEIVNMRRKNIESVITLQKEMTAKLGTQKVTETTLELANLFSEQNTKALNFQNQIMVASLESFAKNIKAFNNNTKTFDENNHKLLTSWATVIKEKSKQ